MSAHQQASDIELYIDQLVLHGFPRAHRYRIAEAMRQELWRRLDADGLMPGADPGDRVSRLNAGSVQVDVNSTPEQVGRQLAGAVYGGLATQGVQSAVPGVSGNDRQAPSAARAPTSATHPAGGSAS